MIVGITGLIGVLTGAVVVYIGMILQMRHLENKEQRRRDCYITIDDFAYLQSFSAQNSFYLPNYILDELFKNISHRKVILSPDETMKIGGYAYKGGRVILENFTDSLTEMINEKKAQLKTMTRQPIGFFSKDDVWS